MANETLSIWTVSTTPRGYPRKFTARRWLATSLVAPTGDRMDADCLDELRKKMPVGLCRLDRHPGDDLEVVETWM
jgi:hypothetical protein